MYIQHDIYIRKQDYGLQNLHKFEVNLRNEVKSFNYFDSDSNLQLFNSDSRLQLPQFTSLSFFRLFYDSRLWLQLQIHIPACKAYLFSRVLKEVFWKTEILQIMFYLSSLLRFRRKIDTLWKSHQFCINSHLKLVQANIVAAKRREIIVLTR